MPGLNLEAKPKSISLRLSQGLLLFDRSMMFSGDTSRWQRLPAQCKFHSVCTAATHFNRMSHTEADEHADCTYRLRTHAKVFRDMQVTGKPRML